MRLIPSILLLSLAKSTVGWRNKNKNPNPDRRLQEVCIVNHDTAQSSTEINVTVTGLPQSGLGLFEFTFTDPPYAPVGGSITTVGWCIDHERPINSDVYSMDVFSGFDPDIHYSETDPAKNAVDKPDMLPNLAWMMNNIDVGDTYDDGNGCSGTITWWELQGAAWALIDSTSPEQHHARFRNNREECITLGIVARAENEGMHYEIDCADPAELVPIVMVADDDEGNIETQVVVSETLVGDIEGLCECSGQPELYADVPWL